MKSPIRLLPAPAPHWVGDGFPVRSVFSTHVQGAAISPFLLLDYGGPARFEPSERPRGVEEHPHKGFETVTIVFKGEVDHRDSGGNAGHIGPGDVQWMTAGRGVVHEEKHGERLTREGGEFEMAQLWVNLPARHKSAEPGYQTLTRAQIPTVPLGQDSTARVIAGRLGDAAGPARTITPNTQLDLTLASGEEVTIDNPEGYTTLLLVRHRRLALESGPEAGEADTVMYDRSGSGVKLRAAEATTALLMAGEPIDEPVAAYGPFVMNTREEISEAMEEYRRGEMGRL
jgi:redox-sensitive bicupin YhaK (pirin superfamily)